MEQERADEWIRKIRADPTDWGLRGVYADELQEAGDGRGEFIALQLQGSDDERVRSLFREHGSRWLGLDLSRALTGVEFRGGFLDRASLAARSALDVAGWSRAWLDPRLATLSRLDRGRGDLGLYTSFVTSPAMGGLRDVEVAAPVVLDALLSCESARAIQVLRFPGALPSPSRLAQIAKSPVFEGLAEVGIGVLSAATVAEQLRRAIETLRRHGLTRVKRIQLSPSALSRLSVEGAERDLLLVAFGPGCVRPPEASAAGA